MPGITLEDFRASVQEVARPNRFLLQFLSLPFGLDFNNDMQYHVRSASLPSRTIGDVSNLFWQGMNYKIAGDPVYDDYTITFLNNIDFGAKALVETWLDGMSASVSNVRTSPLEYKAVIRLDQLGPGNESNIIGTYFLHGAYPKSMDAVELSHETTDAVEEFTSAFSVDYWSSSVAPDQGTGIVSLP